jgi:DNA (cytosine-5)-methyltransferase 1
MAKTKKKQKKTKKAYRTIDLYAGIGGIRLGFEKAGFETVYANDFDPYCKVTYDLNFGEPKMEVADILKLDIDSLPEFDLLLAGFPCQAFSIAGYRKGFEDKERGNHFFRIMQIVKERQPKAIFLENVKNLKGHDKGKTFKIMSETIKSLGYFLPEPMVLNSMEYGNVPQNRERIYIVAFKDKKTAEKFSFPAPKQLKTTFRELLDDKVDDKYYYTEKTYFYDDIKDDVDKDTVYQWRRIYLRGNKKGVCPTLTANMGTGGHNVPIIRDDKGIRKLTPHECARMQGFPKNFRLPVGVANSRLYKQMGNSVTVPVIERIAKNVRDALDGKESVKSS